EERLLGDERESRLATRARRRAADLKVLLVGGSEHEAREWTALQHGAAQRPERIAGVERFLAQYPGSPVAPEATLWLATLYRDEGRSADALARARTVVTRWPDSPSAAPARALADELLRAEAAARCRARPPHRGGLARPRRRRARRRHGRARPAPAPPPARRALLPPPGRGALRRRRADRERRARPRRRDHLRRRPGRRLALRRLPRGR